MVLDEPRGVTMLSPVSVLTEQECWVLLRRLELGRLAYHHSDAVQLAPVNYAVAGDHIIFRTGEGAKLSGLLHDADVAFEVDTMTDDEARSVICRGVAVELCGEQALMTDQLRLRPWVATHKSHIIAIRVTSISGRRFQLTKPWAHMRPNPTQG